MKYNFWHLFRQMHQKNNSQENIQSSKVESSRIHFPKSCEDDHFEHRVSAWLRFKIRLDGDDGCGAIVPPCREYTFSRAHFLSRVCGAIFWRTLIGPFIEVRNVKIIEESLFKRLIPIETNVSPRKGLPTHVSKMIRKMARHHDQERERDGSFHLGLLEFGIADGVCTGGCRRFF